VEPDCLEFSGKGQNQLSAWIYPDGLTLKPTMTLLVSVLLWVASFQPAVSPVTGSTGSLLERTGALVVTFLNDCEASYVPSSMPHHGFVLASAQQRCCKICKKGKACGDPWISRWYKCHRPRGCACNG
jgi:hypothetical protein